MADLNYFLYKAIIRYFTQNTNIMTFAMHDRIFWIYFIVTLFFIIIGLSLILSSNIPNMISISILWVISNMALMIVVYDASIKWSPNIDNDNIVCFIDSKSWCFEPSNKIWIFINVMFILLLIFGTIWAGELHNIQSGSTGSMSGVIILLGGLLLCGLISNRNIIYNGTLYIPFWMSILYLLLWFILTMYVIISLQ